MCGIAGFYCSNDSFNSEDLATMTNTMTHRGPDAAGFHSEDGCHLGHRRLSILDVSENSNQPFYSKDGRYVMVFNGEIYNYLELKKKYEISTVTTSDTEVLIELFAKIGDSFLDELNGMFSIVIFDKQQKELFVARDRVGIKPLYYYHDKDVFAFGSELKAIKKLVGNRLSINKKAISSYLYKGYIEEPQCIYNEVRKFPAGSKAYLKDDSLKVSTYWSAQKKIEAKTITNYTQAKKELKNLIVDSVQRRLISDVPLGTFLSGGTDSTIVTSVAQSLGSHNIKTFSIGFQQAKYNEAEHAKKVAQHLGTDHHEFILSYDDAIEQVEKLTQLYDEPFADSSAIPTLLVSEMARKHVTVALSGDGGDELFLGYGMYQWAKRLNNPLIRTFRKPISAALKLGNNRLKRAAEVFDFKDANKSRSHIFSQEQYFFSEAELPNVFKHHSNSHIDQDTIYNLSRGLSAEESQSLYDIENYLKDDLLVKVDRASMQHSLEVRVPLLDHTIVEFALNLNQSLKIKDGSAKYLLKEVLYDYVPKNIMERPKWGFSIPLQQWLKKELSHLVDQYLNEQAIEKFDMLNYSYVKKLIHNYRNGGDYLYNRIWQLIILQKWLIENE